MAAQQELTWKVSIDPATAIAGMQQLAAQSKVAVNQITADAVRAEREKNQQISAMWGSRIAEQAAAAAKASAVDIGYANTTGQEETRVQREIAAAYTLRQREQESAARTSAAMWAKYEAEKLSATKTAEKQGEQIVTSVAAAKVALLKTEEKEATKSAQAQAAAQQKGAAQGAAASLAAFVQIRESTSATGKAVEELGNHLNVFIGQRIPVAGGLFIRLTDNLRNFTANAQLTEASVLRLGRAVDALASGSGKSVSEIQTFLQVFSKIETQGGKDTAAIEYFGAATAQKLIPQLKNASGEMTALAAGSGEAATGLAGVLAAMGPVGIAAAGIAVELAAVAIGIGVVVKVGESFADWLFETTKAAAEWRGALFDSSQQLGISTTTLSAFEILAKTTGSDLGQVSASLGIFQRNLESAHDPTSKESKLLKELGIEVTTTEDALRQTLTRLAAMPEGFHQTATALELFGRGGKSILAILKEMHGDLDGAIDRFRAMGLIVSREDAKAADEFNDQLALLNFQLRALLGKEAIPAANDALKELSVIMDKLRGPVSVVSQLIGLSLKGAVETATAPIRVFNFVLGDAQVAVGVLMPGLAGLTQMYERLAQALGLIKTVDFSSLTGGASGQTPSESSVDISAGAGIFRKSQKEARKAALEASTVAANQELELQRHLTEQLRLEHEKRGGDIAEFYQKQRNLADDHLETIIKQLTRERAVNEQALAAGGIGQPEFQNKKDELNLRATQAQNKHDEDIARLQLEKNRAEVQEEVTHRKQLADIAQAAREGELNRVKTALDVQAITETEALTRQLDYLKQAQIERVGIIDFELKALSTSAERKAQLDTEKQVSEQKYTDEFKRLTNERMEAANREQAAEFERNKQKVPDDPGVRPGFDRSLGLPPPETLQMLITSGIQAQGAFGGLGAAIANVLDLGRQTGQIFGEVLSNVFGNLANAVGDAVHAFVLFGTAGEGLRKFTATLIAEIARMATVQAVWELAQGLAMLALNFFWPDPKYAASATAHFHAAAVYGGIALVATAAGRVTAGNAFAQASGGGGSTGAGGRNPSDAGSRAGGGSTGLNTTPASQDTNRISYQPQVQVLEFRVKGDAVVEHFAKDYMLNGRTRVIITSDGQG